MINQKLLLILAALSLLFSCSPDQEKNIDLKNFIPENSAYIIKSNNIGAFLSRIDSLTFFGDNPHLINESYKEQLRSLAEHFSGPNLICFTENSGGNFSYTFIGRGSTEEIDPDTVRNKAVKTYAYDSFTIKGYTLEDVEFYTSGQDGIVLASNSRTQLEKVLSTGSSIVKDAIFSRVYSAADPSKTSILLNHKLDKELDSYFRNSALHVRNLASWSVIDLNIEGQKINFNGISSWSENEDSFLRHFRSVSPQSNLLGSITPADAAGFYSFTYSDFSSLYASLTSRDSTGLTISENHLLNYTREAGIVFTSTGTVLALTTTDAVLAREANTFGSELVEEHRGTSILRFTESPKINETLSPLIAGNNFQYFAHLDDFILLSNQPSEIKTLISAYLNQSTLSEQESYKSAMSKLAGSSSLLMVGNSAEYKSQLLKILSPIFFPEAEKLQLENYPTLALQFVVEDNFAHLHGILNTTKSTASVGSGTTNNIEIGEAKIATAAFLLKNHNNNEIEVAFQDEKNVLYLASAGGEIVWKKQIDSRIIGRIHQVDLYKNGNLQLAFTTQNALNILDRNGNPVNPFPIQFKDDVTQPLSVFDYDNNRTYRFVVTQGRELLMYDSKGNIVKGFGFGRANSEISDSPKHIRMGNKDYIVFPETGGELNILSRQGKSRVDVKEKFDFSESGWYEHQNHFVSVNSEGELIRINQDGVVTKEKTDFELQPYLIATENVMVLQSENNLKINDNSITLDFGLYTKPEIFELNNRTYITITDTQAQKVYVFDENANLLEGFPVYGSSHADLFTGKNNHLLIGVTGEENSVNLYKVVPN